ncbi:hypothetical protein E0L36_09995 [Streptomyces sp. AJS327]|uniref:hypothetical protein n=1 Tax=Streptomyces sp. AJS327 TaxID=2545265 RepID=UPI0015DE86BC|nr:hypothetical protein [Streptomyces sp. AJS327]MBA0051214.1 hypothetical protein [Streptomyces sp. AJS327]
MTMRQSLTVVLERNATLSGTFTTEPYEVAWAAEARWFIRTLQRSAEGVRLRVRAQVSPDGLHWCDLEEPRDAAGDLESWPSRDFAGWLRLKGTVESADGAAPADGAPGPSAKVLIYLALKS